MEVKIINGENITTKKIKLTKAMKKYEIVTILITLFPQLRDNSFPDKYCLMPGNIEIIDDNDQIFINTNEFTMEFLESNPSLSFEKSP